MSNSRFVKVAKELKQGADADLLKSIKCAKKGYGASITLSKYSGVTTVDINRVLKTKKVTVTMAAKIKAGIAQWELEKEMASAE